jgi:hypothetical protein
MELRGTRGAEAAGGTEAAQGADASLVSAEERVAGREGGRNSEEESSSR